MGQLRLLTRHFTRRFLENDLIAAAEDLRAPLAAILAALVIVSATVALLFLTKYNPRAAQPLAEKLALALNDKTLLIGGAMIVMGLLTLLAWDALSLDARDFAILGPLPVRTATIFLAKSAALVGVAVSVAIALNVLPALLFPLVVLAKARVGLTDGMGWMFAHAVAGIAGCLFMFLVCMALRGVVLIALPAAAGRRALLALQLALLLALLVTLLLMPLVAMGARTAIDHRSWALGRLPPLWFLGLEEVLIGRREMVFRELAGRSLLAIALAGGVACCVHLLAFLRNLGPLKAVQASSRSAGGRLLAEMLNRVAVLAARDSSTRASFFFTVYTLTRSAAHRVSVAGFLGLGFALAVASAAAAWAGLSLSRRPLDVNAVGLAVQFNLVFFLIAGVRAAVAIPADIKAGWVFRLHSSRSLMRHLTGMRRAVTWLAVVPLLLLLVPVHVALWGWYTALLHLGTGGLLAWLYFEAFFFKFDRVPFVSAYTPGGSITSLKLPFYALGYLWFVYVPPVAELVFIRNPNLFVAFLGLFVVVTARMLAWRSARYRRDRLPVFDADTDSIQQLGLLSPGQLRAPTARLDTSSALVAPDTPWFNRISAGTESDAHRDWRLVLDLLRRDVSFALRRLRTAPAFTLFSAATLALGIGATTAVYSVVYTAALKPPAIADIGRVVNLYHADPNEGGNPRGLGFSLPDYEDLRASQTTFSQMTAWQAFRQTMIVNGVAEVVFGEVVGGDYFSVMGVGAARGRTIQPVDDRPGAPPVVVVSDRFWRERLAADPAAVGKTVRMNGHVFEIIGVTPPAFGGLFIPNITPTPVWVPLSCASLLNYAPRGALDGDREARWLWVKARLKPGRSFSQAAAEVAAIGRRLDSTYPIGRELPRSMQAPPDVSRQWRAMRAADLHITESAHPYVVMLAALAMAAVGLVLLVACTNLANLMLARGAARRQELAVRLALGASRGRLVGEQLVESALVAVVGGVAAIGVARVLMVWIASGGLRLAPGLTVHIAPDLNLSVALVAIGATAIALLVFGLAPALQLTRTDVRSALAADDANATGPRWRGRRNLIAGQVAVSVALVGIAAIAIHQTVLAATRDAGFDLDRLALARMDFTFQGWDEARARQALARVLDVVGRGGGVESAALASALPVDQGADSGYLTSPDHPFADSQRSGRRVRPIVGTPGVFRTLGVAIRRGRPFDERDTAAAEPVIVLSELAARAVFGGSNPMGRQVLMRSPSDLARTETMTVVGVAADTDSGRIGARIDPVVYRPFAQHYEPRMAVVARAHRDPAPLVGRLDIAIRRADPEVGIIDAGTGTVLGGVESVSLRILAGLAGLLGLLALVLAMVGLYGVMSYVTVRRTREMGVRVALGATRRHIVQLVLADGLRPVLEGLAVGFALSGMAGAALRPVFERLMPALDPLMFVIVPIPFLVIALVACYVPARRASRIDPNVALRQT